MTVLSTGKIQKRSLVSLAAGLVMVAAVGSTVMAGPEDNSLRIFVNDRPETSYIANGSITGTGQAMFNALHCSLLNVTDNFELVPSLAVVQI